MKGNRDLHGLDKKKIRKKEPGPESLVSDENDDAYVVADGTMATRSTNNI
jgi:hypothetical protein